MLLHEGGCRGRGTAKGKPLHIRLQVVPRIDRAHLEPAIGDMVATGATVKTDGLRSYLTLGEKGYQHERIIAAETDILEELRWLHVAVSNAKAPIGGTHHGLGRADGKHLQAYLYVYAYRFDRRYRPDTISTAASSRWPLAPSGPTGTSPALCTSVRRPSYVRHERS